MKTHKVRSPALLLLAAVIWGSAFVAQSIGVKMVDPFTLNCVRFFVGGLSLLPVISITQSFHKKTARGEDVSAAMAVSGAIPSSESVGTKSGAARWFDRHVGIKLLQGGALCGLVIALATNLQQFGLVYTEPGKAGFITACYIVFVPLLGIVFKRTPSPLVWIAVVLAVAGLYLLCIDGPFRLSQGDLYILIGAVCFAVHILVIDYFLPYVDPLKLSCLQFIAAGFLSGIMMFLFEKPTWAAIGRAWLPVLYVGVFSSGVAYTLQMVGQKDMNPTTASLILSLESVFAVLFGWVILGQSLKSKELVGSLVMLAAVVLAQFPGREKTDKIVNNTQ